MSSAPTGKLARGCRVAVAAPSAPPARVGGVASAHLNVFRGLARLGCDATLLTYNDSKGLPDLPGVLRSGASPRLRSLLALGTAAWLKLLGSRGITYQLHDVIGSIPGTLAMNRHLARLDPDLLVLPDRGAPGLCLCRTRALVIEVVHHLPMRFIGEPLLGDFCRTDVAQATALERRALRRADAVVCPSRYIEGIFREVYGFAGPMKVIPNAIDVPTIEGIASSDLRHHLDLAADAPVVYIPAAGSLIKGARYVSTIIRALAASYSGPIGFYLSGSIGAELAAELEQAPANARIYRPGVTDHTDTIALVKSCSFGISPTLIENFSMALLEAGCCGVPMITFDVGGNREVIADGDSGFLVPCHDVAAMLQRAEQLLKRETRRRMQAAARRHTATKFNSEVVARQYLDFYAECGRR